ncbi:MAG: hypothetical protein A2061_07435, partial [Gallionellales bacterium GWA2_59_43]
MRDFPKVPSLKREVEKLKPKVEIIIVCEGKNTEPQYFEECVDYYGAGLVSLRVIAPAGVPITLVRAAITERNELLRRMRSTRDSYGKCFRVWAVFDRDMHPSVEKAIQLALDNHIDIAFSDPCFELWPLLHLMNYGAMSDRHALQALLATHMPKYDHAKGAIIDCQRQIEMSAFLQSRNVRFTSPALRYDVARCP